MKRERKLIDSPIGPRGQQRQEVRGQIEGGGEVGMTMGPWDVLVDRVEMRPGEGCYVDGGSLPLLDFSGNGSVELFVPWAPNWLNVR